MADSDWTPSDPPVVVDPFSSSAEELDMKLMLMINKVEESTIGLITDFQVLNKEMERCRKFTVQTKAMLKDFRMALERKLAAGEVTAAAGHVTREEEEDSSTNEARKLVAAEEIKNRNNFIN